MLDRLRKLLTIGSRAPELDLSPIEVVRPAASATRQSSDAHPRFRTSATHRRHGGNEEEVRHRLREAFVPSQPVNSRRMFAGRSELLRGVIEAVEDQRLHVVLYGQRGIGKTSTLRVFAESARDADYHVIHENCGSGSRFDDFFRGICAQIPLIYYGALAPAETQTREGATLADALPEGALGANHFARALSQVIGTRVLIILDEFDRIEDEHFKRETAELIKNLSDASASVQLVIAGVAGNLQDLLEHSPSIRRNITGISVELMSGTEIQQIIAFGEQHANIVFVASARAAILETAQGSPYIARLLCHHSSMSALNDGRRSVELEDVHQAVQQSLREMESRLRGETLSLVLHWLRLERETVLEVARAGLSGSGWFDLEGFSGSDRVRSEEIQRTVEGLNRASGILVQSTEWPHKYRLAEEGLATFLLLAASPLGSDASGQPAKRLAPTN